MDDQNFHSLPPLKRFRLLQQNQENLDSITPSHLPAKKRKETRDLTSSPPTPPPNPRPTSVYLPAKKRIWALHPIDLNVEYKDEPQIKPEIEEADDVEDDGIVCAVCDSTDGDPSDPIVFCDGCDLMVHSTCYGAPLVESIPEGDWFCTQCLSKSDKPKPKPFSCCLCPNSSGPMKPTKEGKWAHIVCGLLVPEVFFADPEGREGIDCSSIPERRYIHKCYICGTSNGCAIDCSEPNCALSFHVTCGFEEDLCIEYREGGKKGGVVAAFCKEHTEIWNKQQKTGKYKIVARGDGKK